MNDTGCRALTDEECSRILAAMDGRYGARDRALFTLGVYTGFRIGEILSLRVGDVWDGENLSKTVCVSRSWMKGRRAARWVPLNQKAAAAIYQWITEAQMLTSDFSNSHLFPAQGRNKSMTTRHAFRILQDAAARAGVSLTGLGTHSMRKSFASRLWNSVHVRQDLAKMAKLLGHVDPANTLRYIQFLDGSLEAAVMEI